MPRTVTVSLPADRTESLLSELEQLDGLLTLSAQRGTSMQPPGDVVTAQVTDRDLWRLMRVLDRRGAGRDSEVSVTMNEPVGMMSASSSTQITRDIASSSFEEMEFMIAKSSTMGIVKLLIMAIAGIVAAVGIATNALHLVIGAMVVAPGFEPLVRIGLGAVGGSRAWVRGLLDTAKGYAVLVPSAGLTALLLQALGTPPLRGSDGYLTPGVLVGYWDRVTLSATVVTLAAGVGGALLVAANRSVLTAGVMIALALVPSASLVGMGLVTGELDLAGRAALRWVHDAGIVTATAVAVLAPMRAQRRRGLQM